MLRLLLIAALAALTAGTAAAQPARLSGPDAPEAAFDGTLAVVRDSVRMTRHVYSWYTTNGGGIQCGAYVYARWPDVLADLNLPGGFSRYTRVASGGTPAHYVPSGGQATNNPARGIDIPPGFLGYDPNLGGATAGPGPDTGYCAQHIANAQAATGNGPMGILNGAPFQLTDWYAVFTVPDGTPVPLYTWEQTEGLTVVFDASFESRQSHEADPAAPGGRRPVASYAWDFGDGTSGSGARPDHLYAEAGTYTVTLLVTDDDGQTNDHAETVTVTAGLLSVEVATETTPVAAGDTLLLVATVTNTGDETVYSVSAGRTFVNRESYPEAVNNVPGNRFRKPTLTVLDSQTQPVTRGSLAPGESFEVRQRYRVVTAGTYQPAGTTGYVPVRTFVRSALSRVTAETSDGEDVAVRDACQDVGCENVTEVKPDGPELTRRITVNPDSVRLGRTVAITVLVENTGTVDVQNVVPGGAPEYADVIYPTLPPGTTTSPPAFELIEAPDPPSLTLAPGQTEGFAFRYRMATSAQAVINGTPQAIPATIVFRSGPGTQGVYNGEVVGALDGCDPTPCTDSLRVMPVPYDIEITLRSSAPVRSGLQPGPVAESVRFVRYVDTADGREPLCESGCVDLLLTAVDDEGEPGANLDIEVTVTQTAALADDLDGGFLCERVALGEVGQCVPAGDPLTLQTNDDGEAFVWYALKAGPPATDAQPSEIEVEARVRSVADDTVDGELTVPVEPTLILDDEVQVGFWANEFGATLHDISVFAGAVSIGEYCERFVSYGIELSQDALALARYHKNLLAFGAAPATAWLCDGAVLYLGLSSPVGAGLALINTVGDPTKKVADILQLTWFAQTYGIDNASDLILLNGPLPPPVVFWFRGDALGFANSVADLGTAHGQLPSSQQILVQELSGLRQPTAATSEADFNPSPDNGVLRMRWEGTSVAEELLSEGYTSVDSGSLLFSQGYLVDNDNVTTYGPQPLLAGGARRPLGGAPSDTTTTAADAGAVAVTVPSWTGEAGQYIEIGRGTVAPEVTQVLAVTRPPEGGSGDVTLALTRPLRFSHDVGVTVRRIAEGTLALPDPPIRRPQVRSAAPTRFAWFQMPTSLASSYALQVATDTTAGALVLVIDVDGITGDSLAVDSTQFARGTSYSWRMRATNGVGAGWWSAWQSFRPGVSIVSSEDAEAPPMAVALGAPFPNPSRGSAALTVELPIAGRVRLAVYDALGREVAVALDGEHAAGRHAVTLPVASLPAGVYMVRLQTGGEIALRRLTVVR